MLRTGAIGELTAPFASTQGGSSPRAGELASRPNEMASNVERQFPSRHNSVGFLILCYVRCDFVNLGFERFLKNNKSCWPGGIGVYHDAEAKQPASPKAHPPAAAARQAPLAELVFQYPGK